MKLENKKTNTWLIATILCLGLLFSQTSEAESSPTALAIRLFNRLAAQINGDDPRVAQMAGLIAQGNLKGAADIAVQDHKFGNVTLFNYFAPMTNLTQSLVVPLNDTILTGIGIVWQGKSYQDVAMGNEEYTLSSSLGLPAPSAANNNHYSSATAANVDYVANLVLNTQTISNGSAVVTNPDPGGLMTTNTWLQTYAFKGTNRKLVQYAELNLMGLDIHNTREQGLAADRVNHDVDWSPGGDPTQFETFCATCHDKIDPKRSAFNHYDAPPTSAGLPGAPVYLAGEVIPKITATVTFPQGFVEGTQAGGMDEWEIRDELGVYGWNPSAPRKGNGVNSYGTTIAQSSAFALNAVTRVWQLVCPSTPSDAGTMQTLAGYFQTTLNYDLRQLFEEVAIRPECLGN